MFDTDKFTPKELTGDLADKILDLVGDQTHSCGRKFSAGKVFHYEHDGGMKVPGFEKPQWIYIQCQCGIGTSLHKLL